MEQIEGKTAVDILEVMDDCREQLHAADAPMCAAELGQARYVVAELIEALQIAVRQNSHDMLMTGDELRICEAALAACRGGAA